MGGEFQPLCQVVPKIDITGMVNHGVVSSKRSVCTFSEFLEPLRPGAVKCRSTTVGVTTNHHFTLKSSNFQEFNTQSILKRFTSKPFLGGFKTHLFQAGHLPQ